jgi:hypothetical protein
MTGSEPKPKPNGEEPPYSVDTVRTLNVVTHFLLVFDHAAGQLVKLNVYAKSAEALAAYEELEALHCDDDSIEVVLLGSDSLETVHVTHPNYFSENAATNLLAAVWG